MNIIQSGVQQTLKNVLRGITPVASMWDTDPTLLTNCTDGNLSTVTGTGSKIMAAAGNFGYLVFDLGTIKTVLIGGRFGLWSTTGTVTIFVDVSDDNITYINAYSSITGATSVAESKKDTDNSALVNGRYIRLRWYVNAAATAYANIYEVAAWELTL